LLQASGPSRMPTSFGQALGHGLQGYQQGRANATQEDFLRDRLKLKQPHKWGDPVLGPRGSLLQKNATTGQLNSIIGAEGNMRPESPYFTPVQTGQGVFSFNARTGKMEKIKAES